MSNQIVISSGAKLRNLNGVITGTTGVLDSVPLGGANGVATLDSSGKVPVSQLPSSVVTYLGTWNAATNTPTLANGTGDAGDMYLCNVAGTVNFGAGPITFAVGDWVLYGSGTWQKSNGQNGTVTSVAVTESGDALTITGSPITTSGTINIGFAGTSAQYVAGDGSLITFPALTGYVPYTGATQTLDMGAWDVNARGIKINGTGGLGHIDYKHQSGTPTGSASSTTMFANVDGDMAWKNDHNYITTLASHANTADRVYTFPNSSGTVALTSDLSGYLPLTGGTLSGLLNISTASYLTSRLKLTNTATGGNIWSVSSGNANNSTNNGLFSIINETLGKNIFALSPTGNIIIGEDVGTANPAYNLQVIGTNTVIRATDLTGNNSNVTLQASNSAAYLSAGYATTAIPLIFQTGNTERLRVASTGTISTTGSITAASAIARGVYFNNTLVAAANNDVLVGLDIAPTFTNGAFTGVTNTVLRLTNTAGSIGLSPVSYSNGGSSSELSLTFGNTTLSASSVLITNRLRTSTAYNNRMILTTPNIAASNAAYLFGLDSVQYNVGMLYDRDNGWLSLLNGSGTNTTTYTSRLYVHSTGNVGINTGGTDAGYKLDVNGTGRFTGALNGTSATFSTQLKVSNSTGTALDMLVLETAFSNPSGNKSIIWKDATNNLGRISVSYDASTGSTMRFGSLYNGGYQSSDLLVITGSGNVGIGTTSPLALLSVNGDAIVGQTSSTGNSVFIQSGWDASNKYVAKLTTDYYGVFSISNGIVPTATAPSSGTYTERMRITSGGKVCIGTTSQYSPALLSVNGLIKANEGIISIGTSASLGTQNRQSSNIYYWIGYSAGLRLYNDDIGFISEINYSTGVFYALSDKNKKKDFEDSKIGLNAILGLKPTLFRMKSDDDNAEKKLGFIAQEVKEFIPQAYSENGEGDEKFIGLNDRPIIAALVKAIQELKAEIDELKNK